MRMKNIPKDLRFEHKLMYTVPIYQRDKKFVSKIPKVATPVIDNSSEKVTENKTKVSNEKPVSFEVPSYKKFIWALENHNKKNKEHPERGFDFDANSVANILNMSSQGISDKDWEVILKHIELGLTAAGCYDKLTALKYLMRLPGERQKMEMWRTAVSSMKWVVITNSDDKEFKVLKKEAQTFIKSMPDGPRKNAFLNMMEQQRQETKSPGLLMSIPMFFGYVAGMMIKGLFYEIPKDIVTGKIFTNGKNPNSQDQAAWGLDKAVKHENLNKGI